jgi:hypothetical protein
MTAKYRASRRIAEFVTENRDLRLATSEMSPVTSQSSTDPATGEVDMRSFDTD